eukprot:CAMPEP_0174820948 /NCGR_PEP_ID=MMETSP1107-20130205/5103_1 /TAXON_ID=36770 /ORGANISM="Paraphysomonas vestita, Strain GFlagA" /LENGTH=367 /DNA_ID=CAMNT_0016037275 /DNA_START=57 /DNA_END=1157 /DNA_ORIENTATION=-
MKLNPDFVSTNDSTSSTPPAPPSSSSSSNDNNNNNNQPPPPPYSSSSDSNNNNNDSSSPPPPYSIEPLQVISSLNDVADATDAQTDATGIPLQLSNNTIDTIQQLQSDEYVAQFNISPDNAYLLLEGLTDSFVQYEVPIGMINKLHSLSLYRLNFIVDDSGSMRADTDVNLIDGTSYLHRGEHAHPREGVPMTRWQEAENRLHILIDILAYIPTKIIIIRFLNAKNIINITHDGKTIEQFKEEGHRRIIEAFSTIDVKYKTPTHRVLTKVFQEAAEFPDPTMHYLFTDGVPSDQPIEAVASLILHRQFPERNPLTLMSCTNEDEEVEWMKQIESTAPYCAEIDDYQDEKREVIYDQGPAFPYTKGFW